MKIEVSVGEIVDKMTILEIKKKNAIVMKNSKTLNMNLTILHLSLKN